MWLSSKEFATKYSLNYDSLKKACLRAYLNNKQFCTIQSHTLSFIYCNGVGYGGKVLKIWHKPFESKEEAGAFVQSYQKALSKGVSVAEFEALMSEDESLAKQGEIQSIVNKEAKLAKGVSEHCEGVSLKPAKRGSQSEGVFVKSAKQSEVKVGENVAHQSLLSQAFAKSEGVFKKDIGKGEAIKSGQSEGACLKGKSEGEKVGFINRNRAKVTSYLTFNP